jgi:iron complex transport system substrate-binding protein
MVRQETFLRIVSLLPSATEIVCALGLTDSLVGITHECDFPAGIAGKSVVTSYSLPTPVNGDTDPLSAKDIDTHVRAAHEFGQALYRIDHVLLKHLKPDLILTQGLCDVCAVNHNAVCAAVETMGSSIRVLDLAPTTLEGVLETFRQVGRATEQEEAARRLVERTQARWDAVAAKVKTTSERPRTLLLEWPEPPFSAGHWNPELLALAGGMGGPWDKIGEASRTLDWKAIGAFSPEVIVLMACGFDTYRALWEASTLTDVPDWFDLPAVRNGDCFAVDGNAYFNRPGPRLAESAEILATILHPETFTEMLPPFAAQIFDPELMDPTKLTLIG